MLYQTEGEGEDNENRSWGFSNFVVDHGTSNSIDNSDCVTDFN